jgi:hypothetical protein
MQLLINSAEINDDSVLIHYTLVKGDIRFYYATGKIVVSKEEYNNESTTSLVAGKLIKDLEELIA